MLMSSNVIGWPWQCVIQQKELGSASKLLGGWKLLEAPCRTLPTSFLALLTGLLGTRDPIPGSLPGISCLRGETLTNSLGLRFQSHQHQEQHLLRAPDH